MGNDLNTLVNGRQPPRLEGNLTKKTTKNELSQFKKKKPKLTLNGCDMITKINLVPIQIGPNLDLQM